MSDALARRQGLPEELALIAAAYPREGWQGHANLGPMARFWLEKHLMFRALAAALQEGADGFRDERVEARAFVPWFAPRYNRFIGELHAHHAVEDRHYFPIFRAADPALARGFDILDADHHAIDAMLHALAAAGGDLQSALDGRGDLGRASAAMAERLAVTLRGLTRHLDDEEDIVIPLILDRTELALGV